LKNNKYSKVIIYFKYLKGHTSEARGDKLGIRKLGSDITYTLWIKDSDEVTLEVHKVEIDMDRGFSAKETIGFLEYTLNGKFIDKSKVMIKHRRRSKEVDEMTNHVMKSMRPDSINFILGD